MIHPDEWDIHHGIPKYFYYEDIPPEFFGVIKREYTTNCIALNIITNNDVKDYGYIDANNISEYSIISDNYYILSENDVLVKISGNQCIPCYTDSSIAGMTFSSDFVSISCKNISKDILFKNIVKCIMQNPYLKLSSTKVCDRS